MKRLINWFRTLAPSPRKPMTARPELEALEDRRVLSKATFAVASGILNSLENYTGFVVGEYVNLLRRQPDVGGFNFMVSQLQHGAAPETIEAGIAGSTEYIFDHGNDPTAWLTGIYQDLLGRLPDSNGLNNWLTHLAQGMTPFAIADAIATSPEREAIVIRSDYTQFLGRIARNDEVIAWLNQVQAGVNRAGVAAGIIASNEFFGEANNDPTTFIIHTYQDVLLRTPSQTEINFWLNVYNNNNP
jgi:hypothetical protein